MADYVNLTPVINEVKQVQRKVDQLSAVTAAIGTEVAAVNNAVAMVDREVKELSEQFLKMMSEQQRLANLQQAQTEIIRIRQEIENKFSNYRIVRENMIGVLQATDLALVKQSTISRVSEELMLATPDYWLAPCLVAISAWIGNDKDLAERAIKEAMRRDKERTALTMALVCRRNQRTATCYEWLQIYFDTQRGDCFSEGTFTYVDAYLNGIFGPDENHMCDDYITKWMNEVQKGENFAEQQAAVWKEYYTSYQVNMSSNYPDLMSNVTEFPQINNFIGRITSINTIQNDIGSITSADIDFDKLTKDIDSHLMTLVCRYNTNEEPLRKEEELNQEIINFDGDREKAKAVVKLREIERKEKTLNLVEQMTKVITSDQNSSQSEKKTAISFLSGYMRKGFEEYISENRPMFPQGITINIDGWAGTTVDGTNAQQLYYEYEQHMNMARTQAINNASNKKPTIFMAGGIAAMVIGLILCLCGVAILGVPAMIGGVVCFVKMTQCKKNLQNEIGMLNQQFTQQIEMGRQKLAAILGQWQNAREMANWYDQNPRPEIIA